MLFQSEGTHSIWCCQLGIQAPICLPCRQEPVFHQSMDWFKGKFTGNHGFYHQIWGFPVNFPIIQFYEPSWWQSLNLMSRKRKLLDEAIGWLRFSVSSRYFSRYPMAMFLVASTPSDILAQHIYHIYIYISHISYIYIFLYLLCMARLFADLTTLQKALVCKWIQVQAQPLHEPEIWVFLGLHWPRAIWLVAFPLFNNMVGWLVLQICLVGHIVCRKSQIVLKSTWLVKSVVALTGSQTRSFHLSLCTGNHPAKSMVQWWSPCCNLEDIPLAQHTW